MPSTSLNRTPCSMPACLPMEKKLSCTSVPGKKIRSTRGKGVGRCNSSLARSLFCYFALPVNLRVNGTMDWNEEDTEDGDCVQYSTGGGKRAESWHNHPLLETWNYCVAVPSILVIIELSFLDSCCNSDVML